MGPRPLQTSAFPISVAATLLVLPPWADPAKLPDAPWSRLWLKKNWPELSEEIREEAAEFETLTQVREVVARDEFAIVRFKPVRPGGQYLYAALRKTDNGWRVFQIDDSPASRSTEQNLERAGQLWSRSPTPSAAAGPSGPVLAEPVSARATAERFLNAMWDGEGVWAAFENDKGSGHPLVAAQACPTRRRADDPLPRVFAFAQCPHPLTARS